MPLSENEIKERVSAARVFAEMMVRKLRLAEEMGQCQLSARACMEVCDTAGAIQALTRAACDWGVAR